MSTDSSPSLPEGLRIEAAGLQHAELLCTLIRELAEFEHLSDECQVTPEALREHLLGDGRSADAVLAWVGEEPVGFAVYYKTFSTFVAKPGLYLEDLFVREAHRGRGIGRALLKEVGRIAHRANAGRYEWTVLNWNQKARRLYSSIGAKEMSDWLILRMEAEDLASFACDGSGHGAGGGGHRCTCGGKGQGHCKQ